MTENNGYAGWGLWGSIPTHLESTKLGKRDNTELAGWFSQSECIPGARVSTPEHSAGQWPSSACRPEKNLIAFNTASWAVLALGNSGKNLLCKINNGDKINK